MNTDNFTTNDIILLSQFNDWRFGQYEKPAEKNDVLRELNFHPQYRSHLEIWREALQYVRKSEFEAAKMFYQSLADKHRDKYIYAI